MEGMLSFVFCMWVGIFVALPFVLDYFSIGPNTTSLGNGEGTCMSVVEHVTSDEKYEYVI